MGLYTGLWVGQKCVAIAQRLVAGEVEVLEIQGAIWAGELDC